jgi:hypothetical protein
VKQLKVGNNSASVTNTVTIQHTDGTNVIVIEQVTLAPLERIGYEEGTGVRVFDSAGREKVTNGGLPTGNANTSDVVANAAATYLTGSGLQIGGRVQAGRSSSGACGSPRRPPAWRPRPWPSTPARTARQATPRA